MLGSSCSPCCDVCANIEQSCPNNIYYSYGPVFSNVPQNQEIAASIQTITVPLELSLPVLVKFCGSADDGIAINGIRISRFAQRPEDVEIAARTFTIGNWNDGGPAAANITMCFYELNPLP